MYSKNQGVADLPPVDLQLRPPPPTNEKVMADYCDRVSDEEETSLFDGVTFSDEIRVSTPLEPVKLAWDSGFSELKTTIESLREEVESQGAKIKSQGAKIKSQGDRLDRIEPICSKLLKKQVDLCVGNMLISMAKRVFPKGESKASTHRLQNRAADVTFEQLEKAGVPGKYWDYLKKLPEYVDRKSHSAHDSKLDLAELLVMKESKETGFYDKWADAFRFTYGSTVEEVEKRRLTEQQPSADGPATEGSAAKESVAEGPDA